MTISNFKLIVIASLAFGLTFASCGTKSNNNKAQTEQSQEQGKEYTSAYICPMHCEGSGSDKEGKCPVCGMDYVKNENLKKDVQGY